MKDINVYVEKTGRRIAPFNDPIGETPVLNRQLKDWQAQAFREAGLAPLDRLTSPCLVIPDTLFATGGALRAFVDHAAGRNAVLVLARSRFAEMSTPVQPGVVETESGWRFDHVRFEDGTGGEHVPVVVDPDEKILEIPTLPGFSGTDLIRISLPRHPVMTLHHWVHILWANQYAFASQWRRQPRWRVALRVLWAALRAGSTNKWKVLGKLNRFGRGCDIHPTAIIEGSTLGEGVRVGPYARILFSNVGDRAVIMAYAQVEASVLGERSLVCQTALSRSCVLYPEATLGMAGMQQCVLGRQAATTYGSIPMDMNFENTIQVRLDRKPHDTGKRFLGSAFGHRCRIGSGFWLAAGCSIPNDYFIIRDPDTILSKVPEGLDSRIPVVLAGNTLRYLYPPRLRRLMVGS